MTAAANSKLRIVSFAALDGSVWGAALDAGRPAVAFGTPDAAGGAADAVRFEQRDGEWELSGDDWHLLVSPRYEPAAGYPRAGDDELCQVRGRLVVGGTEVEVDSPAIRNAGADVDLGQLDSIRGVWGWFEDDQAISLVAARPRGTAGQEGDWVAARLFDTEGLIVVDEPRLSTTYTADGLPSRATLELWVGDGEEQYPRRAAGEALGPGAAVSSDALHLQATPLRCHTRGLDGPGVYLLARF
jgi:hypothetical protein